MPWGGAGLYVPTTCPPLTPPSPSCLPQGARQLAADVDAVVAVFGEHTSRPAAHFKETREACRLLALPLADTVELLVALDASHRSDGGDAGRAQGNGTAATAARAALAAAGVKVLTQEQAACVLNQRLDVIAPGAAGRAVATGKQPLPAQTGAVAMGV